MAARTRATGARPGAMMPAIVITVRRATAPLPMLAVLAASAFASDIGLADRWKNQDADRVGFAKVVVVGITHDAAARRQFEDRFVSLLRGRSMQGITSYTLVPDLANVPDPQKVVETILADGVDGVFTVRFAPIDDKAAEEAWPEAWRAEIGAPGRVRDYVDASIRRPFVDAKRYGAEIIVWEVASGRRLWAGRFQPLKRKELQKNASAMTQDVMNQLVYEKVF